MGIVVSYRMATKVKGVPAGLGPPFKSEAKKEGGRESDYRAWGTFHAKSRRYH